MEISAVSRDCPMVGIRVKFLISVNPEGGRADPADAITMQVTVSHLGGSLADIKTGSAMATLTKMDTLRFDHEGKAFASDLWLASYDK